jgi:hypothetical protein
MKQHCLLSRSSLIAPSDPEFELALEAERDMQLLGFVFEQPNPCSALPTFISLVRRMLEDSGLPQDSGAETPGRDAQFELFVAAVCQSAGLEPVGYEEPDVICSLDGVRYAIAAKRVKSLGSLDKRVKKAAEQIQRASLPGIIAVETCVLLNRNNERIYDAGARGAVREAIQGCVLYVP